MAVHLCHEHHELLEHETDIVGARPGAVLLSRSALHPGGGGQESDEGLLEDGLGKINGDGSSIHLGLLPSGFS